MGGEETLVSRKAPQMMFKVPTNFTYQACLPDTSGTQSRFPAKTITLMIFSFNYLRPFKVDPLVQQCSVKANDKLQFAKNEFGLDSAQNRSKFFIF